ncbi:RNA-binding protein [Sporobolomyces salmoneus]|uniref:RNA-binding protein n=1 Tax=Sporobolomyces salmoneus TaxID=183962 RepID=UPI003176C012
MHARLIPTARLAARYASTGLQSRVHASRVLNLGKSVDKVQFQSRLFNSTRLVFEETKPTPEAESTSFPASSSPVTEPSTSSSPVDSAQEPAAAASPVPAEAPKGIETPTAAAGEEDISKRTVFVGGLSWNVDNQWLEDEVLKALDLEEGVSSVRIARNHLGKSKGFAFVELTSPELVSQLAGLRINIDGRDVEFVPSTSGPSKPRSTSPRRDSSGPRNPPSSTLWVGNVSWSANPETLEDAFSRFGEIQRVHQPMDRETGRSRGIAYVEFGTVEEAQEAYQTATEEGIEVEGRAIRVDYAEVKSPREDGGRHNRNSSGGFKPRGQNRERRGFGGGRGGGGDRGASRGGRRDDW